jgi:hypothetical protein
MLHVIIILAIQFFNKRGSMYKVKKGEARRSRRENQRETCRGIQLQTEIKNHLNDAKGK